MVMNLRVPYNAENFATSLAAVSFQDGLCAMELVNQVNE
jgi:hypothetical protein